MKQNVPSTIFEEYNGISKSVLLRTELRQRISWLLLLDDIKVQVTEVA
jgi:hypothetical protein